LTSSKQTQRILPAIYICFFVSGAAGLIYEIVWIRLLGLVFGHTVHAVTTVLVAFMAGLALGSYLCGRVSERIENILKLYGLLEIGIGFYCLLTPWLLEGIKIVYLRFAQSVEPSFTVFTLVQFSLASLVLVFPTTLMGATLPILSRYFVMDPGSAGRRVGTLYAVNTFGAVLGTYLAGFELLPALGIRHTLFFAVALNIGIGLSVLMLGPKRMPLLRKSSLLPPFMVPSALDQITRLLLLCLAYSGAASMVYEIAWTRALSLIIGSSTYAFTIMLLTFLVGIAAGSALFARFTKGMTLSLAGFAGLQCAIAVSAAAIFPLFDQLPELFLWAFGISQKYSFILTIQTAISFIVMLLPTMFIGATFPCALQIVSKDLKSIGLDVGRTYAANTVGSILGSFAAGFILIPLIGVQASIKAAILINLFIGLTLFLIARQRMVLRMILTSGIAAAAWGVLFLPAWDQQMMSSGPSIYAPAFLRDNRTKGFSVRDNVKGDDLLFYKDGISTTVTVHQRYPHYIYLRVNGKTDASNGVDMKTQLMIGHLPALLHPNPKSALVIGLGSGVTVGALEQYGLDKIDVVEIEPAVVKASNFFKNENRDALSDPRTNLAISDARNFLLTSSRQYDLIVSEPSNPWIGGVATLFTVEFFNLERKHLKSGGIMAQWVQGYSISPETLQMIASSFLSVFPNATLWKMDRSDYLLVGTIQPLMVVLDRIREIYGSHVLFRQDMARINIFSPEAILKDFYLDEKDLERFAAGAGLNTDDRLPLEFSTPRTLYLGTSAINEFSLHIAKQSSGPPLKGTLSDGMSPPAVHPTTFDEFLEKGKQIKKKS
jgi:spermidine synthase